MTVKEMNETQRTQLVEEYRALGSRHETYAVKYEEAGKLIARLEQSGTGGAQKLETMNLARARLLDSMHTIRKQMTNMRVDLGLNSDSEDASSDSLDDFHAGSVQIACF